MKTLVIELTDDQLDRLQTVANLAATKPEHVALGLAFDSLDSADNWGEAEHSICHAVDFYAEGGECSDKREERRVEESAPDRRLRLARPQPTRTVTLRATGTVDTEIEIPEALWSAAQRAAKAGGITVDKLIEGVLRDFFASREVHHA